MNIRRQSGKFQFEEDPFSKNVEGISIIYHRVSLLMKFLQTKLQVKKMNLNYYELYCAVTKNRIGKKIVKDEKKNIENDYFNFDDFVIPNHYNGRKWKKLISQMNHFK